MISGLFHHTKAALQSHLRCGSGLSLCHSYKEVPLHLGSTFWAAISWFPSQVSRSVWNAHISPNNIIPHGGTEGWVNVQAVGPKLTSSRKNQAG